MRKKKYTSEKKGNKLCIICLDNIEQLIRQNDENQEFGLFLAELVDECPNLCVLMTSSITLQGLPNQIVPEIQWVKALRNASAAQLFFDRCGPFDEEIIDWIFKDAKYPYHKVLTSPRDKEFIEQISAKKELSN